jgi:formate dehydrogenase iron-sulfur subunit
MTEIALDRPDAQRMGFFTDTTTCIGCKACEVACKQWNDLPADNLGFNARGSYDHTTELNASTWRHVRFIEVDSPPAAPARPTVPDRNDRTPMDAVLEQDPLDLLGMLETPELESWLFMSDVCKHCTNAGCLDACPTGALIRTEFETVIVQPDVCNGCGYCIPSCPFGVIDRDHVDGRAAKCTLCYDRLQDGLEPACAKSCPTDSITFGPYDELLEIAGKRVTALQERGMDGAYIYGAGDDVDEVAGGLGAFFLLTQPPEVYGLPYRAESPVQENVVPATLAAMGAGLLAAAAVAAAFVGSARTSARREGRQARRGRRRAWR